MKKCKILLLLLLLLVGRASAYEYPSFVPTIGTDASDDVPSINFVVWTHSGEKIAYPLSEHPVVISKGDKLQLSTNIGIVEYVATDVKKFTFAPLYYFVAWLNDGSRYAYALDQHPVVTYSDGELQLSTSQQQISYPAVEVHKFTFSASDISCDGHPPVSVTAPLEQITQFNLQQGEIHFSSCRAGTPISLYALDGKQLHTVTVDANGRASIDTSVYPAGVYIIKTETITHKIIKR